MAPVLPCWVLVHSPLVGPGTWRPLADTLRQRDCLVVAPPLEDAEEVAAPYWQQHVASVVRGLEAVSSEQPLVLVGHSGAGPLLPAIGREARRPITAYVFVDAGLPHGGTSRLGEMAATDQAFAGQFDRQLAAGGRYPTWTDEQLRLVVPDAQRRQQLLHELRPRGLQFFSESLPVVTAWPDAPCAYLQFSSAYDRPAAWAREAGWPVRTFEAGHFHMLVDPTAVAATLLDLVEEVPLPRIETRGA